MLDISADTRDRAVLDLQPIDRVAYVERNADGSIAYYVKFSRSWDDDVLPDGIWLAQQMDQRGKLGYRKAVSAMFVSDLLAAQRENCEVTYRS